MKLFYQTVDGRTFDTYAQAKAYEEKCDTFLLLDSEGQPTRCTNLARYVYCPSFISIENFNLTVSKRMGTEIPGTVADCGLFTLEEGTIPTLILSQTLIEETTAKQ